VSDIDTAVVDSLKVLDLKWPIREADIMLQCCECPLSARRRIEHAMGTPQLPTLYGPVLLILHHLTFGRGTEFWHGFKLVLGRVEHGVIGVVGVRGTPWVRGNSTARGGHPL
jgi:hypothetical protein